MYHELLQMPLLLPCPLLGQMPLLLLPLLHRCQRPHRLAPPLQTSSGSMAVEAVLHIMYTSDAATTEECMVLLCTCQLS
jgi:hypothetical protein